MLGNIVNLFVDYGHVDPHMTSWGPSLLTPNFWEKKYWVSTVKKKPSPNRKSNCLQRKSKNDREIVLLIVDHFGIVVDMRRSEAVAPSSLGDGKGTRRRRLWGIFRVGKCGKFATGTSPFVLLGQPGGNVGHLGKCLGLLNGVKWVSNSIHILQGRGRFE